MTQDVNCTFLPGGWKAEGDAIVTLVARYQCPMAQEIYRYFVFATTFVLSFSVYVSLALAFSTISESHVHFWKTTCWMSKCSPLAGSPQALLMLNERQNCYGLDDQCLLHACLIPMLFTITFAFDQRRISGGLF